MVGLLTLRFPFKHEKAPECPRVLSNILGSVFWAGLRVSFFLPVSAGARCHYYMSAEVCGLAEKVFQ